MSSITRIILVGGSGKGLSPLSRETIPRQFIPLVGTQSTVQQTLRRVADRGILARPAIATNEAYHVMAKQQAKDVGVEVDTVAEPSRPNRRTAMAVAGAYARYLCATAVLELASTHLVTSAEEFRADCREGLTATGGLQ